MSPHGMAGSAPRWAIGRRSDDSCRSFAVAKAVQPDLSRVVAPNARAFRPRFLRPRFISWSLSYGPVLRAGSIPTPNFGYNSRIRPMFQDPHYGVSNPASDYCTVERRTGTTWNALCVAWGWEFSTVSPIKPVKVLQGGTCAKWPHTAQIRHRLGSLLS